MGWIDHQSPERGCDSHVISNRSNAVAKRQRAGTQVLETMQKDPDYLEFLRQKALKEQDAEAVQEAQVAPSQEAEQVNS